MRQLDPERLGRVLAWVLRRMSDPEPDSTDEQFELWLDRQGFDNVERLFDGGHWNPKVSAKHARVREWLKQRLQAQRLREWLQKNRQAEGLQKAHSTRNVAINLKLTAIMSAVVASAWIVWQLLHRR